MNPTDHLSDEIQDLLDGRISGQKRSLSEEHVKTCEQCRSELERLRAVKRSLHRDLSAREAPPGLAAAVSTVLDGEDQSTSPPAERMPRSLRGRRAILAYGAVAAVVLAGILLYTFRARDLATQAARAYSRYQGGSLELQMRMENTQVMESFFAEKGILFRTRVFDLGMMGYRLAGGRVHTLGKRPSALFVYQGDGGKLLVCQMFEGNPAELPADASLRRNAGILFRIYKRQNQTLVFWPEGGVICVLASDIPEEDVIALAFAKAVRVS